MSDATHNTLVTILLIIAAVIVFIMLGRWFGSGSLQRYAYQPASVVEVYRDRGYAPAPSHQSVVAYSRPSYSYTYVPSTQYESSSYQTTTYSYSCDGMGNCWTNQ